MEALLLLYLLQHSPRQRGSISGPRHWRPRTIVRPKQHRSDKQVIRMATVFKTARVVGVPREMQAKQPLPQVRLSSARRNGYETVNSKNNNRLAISTWSRRDHVTMLKNLTGDALPAQLALLLNNSSSTNRNHHHNSQQNNNRARGIIFMAIYNMTTVSTVIIAIMATIMGNTMAQDRHWQTRRRLGRPVISWRP